MPRQFLEDLVASTRYGKRRPRRLTLPVSIGIHLLVFTAIVLAPILMSSDLPEPAKSAIPAFLVEAAAPPPPPPPPPPAAAAAPKPKTVQAPKVEKVEQPKPVEVPKFVAPVETPKLDPKPQNTMADASSGVDEGGVADGVPGGSPAGEPGGVVGGVEGGVKGGVEGGTVGGVEGGTVGGISGGVIGGLPKDDPPPAPDKPVRVGGSIQAPKKMRNADPVYPAIAREARVQGVVVLECVISPQGRVASARVLKGIPMLDDSAVDAVKKWVYSPTLLNGVPVPVIMTVTVTFKLN